GGLRSALTRWRRCGNCATAVTAVAHRRRRGRVSEHSSVGNGSPMQSFVPLAAFLLLFLAVGIGFIFAHLVAGKFIRPNRPDAEKKTIYECGEPTIGSAWIQFDLRF